MQQQLLAAITDKSARVGIIGLGYVGLPLAGAFIGAGFRVLGFDVDQAKVDQLNNDQSFIKHIPSETVAGWIAEGQFEATCLQERMTEADVLLICVPTPLTGSRDPDLRYVEGTARSIA
ncbi:MAG: NAD(P)-binding domain-containing protein, partial [Planctomycetota bacterium]|nr:NAD(P)-binding domain-containing protein [Planctomycetota bacterium]